MAIPANVAKMETEANEMFAQLNAPSETPAAPPSASPEPAPAPAAADPAPQTADHPNSDSWQHRFNVMAGRAKKADQENNALRQQVQQLAAQVQQLTQLPPDEPPQYIRPEEVTEFGADLMDVIGRKAREVIEPDLNQARQTAQAAMQQAAFTQQESNFQLALTRAVPNWEAINNDPRFIDWLNGVDPFTGQQRKVTLQAAYNQFDAGTVISGFRAFLQESQQQQGQANIPPLSSQIQPARTAGEVPPAQGRLWTQADINKVMADVRANRYRGKQAELDAIMRDIDMAHLEGRYRP